MFGSAIDYYMKSNQMDKVEHIVDIIFDMYWETGNNTNNFFLKKNNKIK